MNFPLVLASSSQTRKKLLQNIGLDFQAIASPVDEDLLKEKFPHLSAKDLALTLAQNKAQAVSAMRPNAYVLGCDLIVDCDKQRFDKAKSFEEATKQLQALRGKKHHIISAISMFQAEKEIWNNVSIACVSMWNFSDDFIDSYVKASMPEIFNYAGCYNITEKGAILFTEITGDTFIVQGLQIFELLQFLRKVKGEAYESLVKN